MKAEALSQKRTSLLNILTRSDTLRLSPGLEMTASIRRLADERKFRDGAQQEIHTEVSQVKECW